MSGTQLVRYDAMCSAIAAAYEVDEVKGIRDKARAIEVYSRQAKNVEAERQACEIRLRAECKCGELSKQLPTAPGRRTDLTSPHAAEGLTKAETLQRTGISTDQVEQWERLAAVPKETFEQALSFPTVKPPLPAIHDGRGLQVGSPICPEPGGARRLRRFLLLAQPRP